MVYYYTMEIDNETQKYKTSFISKILNSNYIGKMFFFDWVTLFMIIVVLGFVALVLLLNHQDKKCLKGDHNQRSNCLEIKK